MFAPKQRPAQAVEQRKVGMFKAAALAAGLAVSGGCGTFKERVDLNENDKVAGAVLESKDIKLAAAQMVKDIIESGVLAKKPGQTKPVTIYSTGLQNDTSTPMDTKIITDEILIALGRAARDPKTSESVYAEFLDRSQVTLAALKEERTAKRSGAVEGDISDNGIAAADLLLTGRVSERSHQSTEVVSATFFIPVMLTNLETGKQIWQDRYPVKFRSDRSAVNR